MSLGLGNYIYDIEFTDNGATFKFVDPDDTSNNAEAVVRSDEVNGSVDSREAADLAFNQVRADMDRKRLDRLQEEEQQALSERKEREIREADSREEFFSTTQDVQVQPHHIEEDGTHVYNAEVSGKDDGETKDKKNKK